MCPSVLAPSSPYSFASGAWPMPTLSSTRTSARIKKGRRMTEELRKRSASDFFLLNFSKPDRMPGRFHLDGVENPIRIFRDLAAPVGCFHPARHVALHIVAA